MSTPNISSIGSFPNFNDYKTLGKQAYAIAVRDWLSKMETFGIDINAVSAYIAQALADTIENRDESKAEALVIMAQTNDIKNTTDAIRLTTLGYKNDTLGYKNTALVYRNEAIQAKEAIAGYLVPTNATYTPEQINALNNQQDLENFLNFKF